MKTLIISATFLTFGLTSLQAVELTGDHKKIDDIHKSINVQATPAMKALVVEAGKTTLAFFDGCMVTSGALLSPKECKKLGVDLLKLKLKGNQISLKMIPVSSVLIEKAIKDLENLKLSE